MGSEARARLTEMIEESGGDGFLKLDNGMVLRPDAVEFPPCRCPQHRASAEPPAGETGLSARLGEVNRRSRESRP